MQTTTHAGRATLLGLMALLVLLAGALIAADLATAAGPTTSQRAAHNATTFPLTGAHASTRCEACHQRGVFKGTPTLCAACHMPGARYSTVQMRTNHMPV